MEAQATFVRANGIVVLDAIAHVGLYVALVVNPVDAELNDTVGDAQPLNEIGAVKLRMFVVLFLDGTKYLADGLDILGLVGETLLQASYYFCCFHNLVVFFIGCLSLLSSLYNNVYVHVSPCNYFFIFCKGIPFL